jgi:hypothetical protein
MLREFIELFELLYSDMCFLKKVSPSVIDNVIIEIKSGKRSIDDYNDYLQSLIIFKMNIENMKLMYQID